MSQTESWSVMTLLTIYLTKLDKMYVFWHQNLKCSIGIILGKNMYINC